MKELEFTGERVIPGKPELQFLLQEHVVRYLFASQQVKNRIVLDVACGTGYGSNLLLNRGARKAIGIDNSIDAINYCIKNYLRDNLEFKIGDCENLEFDEGHFDMIVSFETIEHLKNQENFLLEIKRLLKKSGLFIVSTPNKLMYPEGNPYHYKEFTYNEFKGLLLKFFPIVDIFYQFYPPSIIISNLSDSENIKEVTIPDDKIPMQKEEALFFVAVCSYNKIKFDSKLFVFKESTILEGKNSHLEQLRTLNKSKDTEIEQLRTLNKSKDTKLSDLQKEIDGISKEYYSFKHDIENSKVWKILRNFDRLRGK